MLRRFIGPTWNPRSVRLMVGDESCVGDLGAFGDAQVTTGHPHSSLTIPRSLLQRPVPPSNGDPDGAPGDGEFSLPAPAMPEDFEQSIEQLVMALLGDAYPDIHSTASVAAISVRTLQRRLAEAGLTYSQVVSRSRMRLATRWLAGSDFPVSEIAQSLGYTDAANFARAFRRRTGISPSAYRRACKEE
jgi:AraC-like DNA-binding protein